ncbi:MAG: hypothetical protein PVI26_10125, partial [Chitinispirillia bacterium]
MKKLTNAQKLILSNGSDNQNGSVLLFSIACIIVISTIGLMSFNFNSKERIISSNYKKNVQAFYLAEAGIEQAKAQLKDMSLQEIYDASQENDGYLFPSDTLGKGRYHVQIKGDLTPVDDPGFKIYYESRETPETTKEQDLTVSVITSEMQCPNGDEIYCKVEMSLDDGNNWIVLFNGDDVDGGESQTFSGVSVNSRIQFYIFAWNHDDNRYRHRYTNISDDEHFIYLKNG